MYTIPTVDDLLRQPSALPPHIYSLNPRAILPIYSSKILGIPLFNSLTDSSDSREPVPFANLQQVPLDTTCTQIKQIKQYLTTKRKPFVYRLEHIHQDISNIHHTRIAEAGLQQGDMMGPGVATPPTGTATGYGIGRGYAKARIISTNRSTYPMISMAYMYLPTLAEHVFLGAYPFQNMTEPTMSQVNLQRMKRMWKPSQLPQTHCSSGQFQAIPPIMKKTMIKARITQASACSQAEREMWMLVPGGGLTSTQVLSLYAQQRSTTRKGKNRMKKMTAYNVKQVFQGQQLGLTPPYTVLAANIQILFIDLAQPPPLQSQQTVNYS